MNVTKGLVDGVAAPKAKPAGAGHGRTAKV
jgi:hypothetical protein